MAKSFLQELEATYEKLYGEPFDAEVIRVHRQAVRDARHAMQMVDIPKPDPWAARTGTTI